MRARLGLPLALPLATLATFGALGLAACGDDGATAQPDAPPADASTQVTTENCTYAPLVPTANAGTPIAAAALTAGAAERVLDVPVGTALGGYTARAQGSAGIVDARAIHMSGVFNPSIGVVDAPRVKAIALTAGPETIVVLKVDMIFVYEGMVYDLEQRLGAAYAGKILIASSHSHSAWAQFTAHGPLKVGAGEMRDLVYQRMLDTFEATARDALAARRPAKLGVSYDGNWDPQDLVNHDRRSENDGLPGGNVKDKHMFLVRIDGTDDTPIGAMIIFGEHGTLNGEDNPFASTDAPGALERTLQEQFATPMVVMHLQSAGGDNSPSGHGAIDCSVKPGKPSDPCFVWATEEGHGRAALPLLLTAYANAGGAAMKSELALAMVTRSIETGPAPETFAIRADTDHPLAYAPFVPDRLPDRQIYEADNTTLKSPIDEFDAPVGAALCQDTNVSVQIAQMPGTDGLSPYASCLRIDLAAPVLSQLFHFDFKTDATHPVCEMTRTTISAIRLGDYLIGTMPGELTVLLADYLRSKSPEPEDHTIVVGYAQGHVGYLLRPEDWVLGGYESSITFWGPLEAEHIAEQEVALWPSVLGATRADASSSSQNRMTIPTNHDGLAIDDPAPDAGTVPATVPADAWVRTGAPATAQPAATIPRVSGVATFVFYGDDPNVQTPHVTLQREVGGSFTDVTRHSGRVVDDIDLVRAYTPSPLQRGSGPQHHIWAVDWQAVPWLGAPGLDDLAHRADVPLGDYRFHVTGKGWTLDSAPFTVVPGGLALTQVQVNGSSLDIATTLHAPKGWRLLDMAAPSNNHTPYAGQLLTIQRLTTGNVNLGTPVTATTDASGKVSIPQVVGTTAVSVTDAFGNSVTQPIQ